MQYMEKNLELNPNFFLSENVDHKQKIIPKKKVKKRSSNKKTLENLINDAKPNLMKTFTGPSNGMIVDDIINVNYWEVNKA